MSKHQRTKHERTIKYGRKINRNATPGVTAWCFVCERSGEPEPTHRWAEGCPPQEVAA